MSLEAQDWFWLGRGVFASGWYRLYNHKPRPDKSGCYRGRSELVGENDHRYCAEGWENTTGFRLCRGEFLKAMVTPAGIQEENTFYLERVGDGLYCIKNKDLVECDFINDEWLESHSKIKLELRERILVRIRLISKPESYKCDE